MDIFPLRRITSQRVAENPYWEYWLDTYRLRDGSEHPYHYVHTHGSVMVVPIADDGRLVLVRQFRYLWQRESIEFPGGGVPDGTSARDHALRELQEEAGFAASLVEHIGDFNPMNGVTDERCSVFIARGLVPAAKSNDPIEETQPLLLTESQLRQHIADGTIWDGMTLAAWALFIARQTS
ncbi:MAG: NUDIX hydrolase [Chlorobi bacterium]|nr:NUDIX hydrolase [Chlorobiota bacterium]